jgi:hypothetical protein
LFEYDTSVPLEAVSALVEENSTWNRYDLSYRSAEQSERVCAWLILPSGPGAFAFTVLLHGGGQDRTASISEGTLLTEMGIASLLIDLPHARHWPDFAYPEREQHALTKQSWM